MLALNADGSMTNLTTGHTTAAPETEVTTATRNIMLDHAWHVWHYASSCVALHFICVVSRLACVGFGDSNRECQGL